MSVRMCVYVYVCVSIRVCVVGGSVISFLTTPWLRGPLKGCDTCHLFCPLAPAMVQAHPSSTFRLEGWRSPETGTTWPVLWANFHRRRVPAHRDSQEQETPGVFPGRLRPQLPHPGPPRACEDDAASTRLGSSTEEVTPG